MSHVMSFLSFFGHFTNYKLNKFTQKTNLIFMVNKNKLFDEYKSSNVN